MLHGRTECSEDCDIVLRLNSRSKSLLMKVLSVLACRRRMRGGLIGPHCSQMLLSENTAQDPLVGVS